MKKTIRVVAAFAVAALSMAVSPAWAKAASQPAKQQLLTVTAKVCPTLAASDSECETTRFRTLNNKPTQISHKETQSYVASVTPRERADGTLVQDSDTNTVTTGYELTLKPMVKSNGKVVVAYSMESSAIERWSKLGDEETGTYEVPVVAEHKVSNTAQVQADNTVVLSLDSVPSKVVTVTVKLN